MGIILGFWCGKKETVVFYKKGIGMRKFILLLVLIGLSVSANAEFSQPFKGPMQSASGVILFISFSMPESLLFALSDEASELHIPVVINGLVDGDFKKTIETFERLNRHAKKANLHFEGLSIDPIWFQQFQIKSVPALVVTERPLDCKPQTICANQAFDVVYGNASLKKALTLIAEKGDVGSRIAQKILEDRHVE